MKETIIINYNALKKVSDDLASYFSNLTYSMGVLDQVENFLSTLKGEAVVALMGRNSDIKSYYQKQLNWAKTMQDCIDSAVPALEGLLSPKAADGTITVRLASVAMFVGMIAPTQATITYTLPPISPTTEEHYYYTYDLTGAHKHRDQPKYDAEEANGGAISTITTSESPSSHGSSMEHIGDMQRIYNNNILPFFNMDNQLGSDLKNMDKLLAEGKYGDVKQAEVQFNADLLKTIDGNYNWTEISRLLALDPEQLTQEQLTALAGVYLGMTKFEDIEHFVASGYGVNTLYDVNGTFIGNYYESTDTFKALTAFVTMYVNGIASNTVWKDKPYDEYYTLETEDQIRHMIENMQVMQIANEVCCFPQSGSGAFDSNSYQSPYPFMLSRDESTGNLMIQVASGAWAGFDPPFQLDENSKKYYVGFSNLEEKDNPEGKGTDCHDAVYYLHTLGTNYAILSMGIGTDDLKKILQSGGSGLASEAALQDAMKSVMLDMTTKYFPGFDILYSAGEAYKEAYEKISNGMNYLNDERYISGIYALGGGVNFTSINGTDVIHDIYLNDTTVNENIEAFKKAPNNEMFSGYTNDQIRDIILNGEPNDGSTEKDLYDAFISHGHVKPI